MPAVISMLRAVNVGGNNKIKMESLRALYEGLGFLDVQSYVQSGNVVFRTTQRSLPKLSALIEDAIEASAGFRADVILRTADDLRRVIEGNPFKGRVDVEPAKLLVTFLITEPDAAAQTKVGAIDTAPEELHLIGREVYIHFPNGVARPKVAWPKIERALGTAGTGRNWNSVNKLLEMAEALEKR